MIGHTSRGRLGGDIGRKPGRGNQPSNRTHVDDGTAAGLSHSWRYGLDQKKLMPKVHSHSVIPIVGCYLFQLVTIVISEWEPDEGSVRPFSQEPRSDTLSLYEGKKLTQPEAFPLSQRLRPG